MLLIHDKAAASNKCAIHYKCLFFENVEVENAYESVEEFNSISAKKFEAIRIIQSSVEFFL